ncbi:hypothetical protein FE257_011071 [Aspergillus nanangensis]|uniref:Rdx family-domain-containing protein n=1 Tax=Aspergillus nanangensis TaxID=2582783 RepID=A0AAD4CHZ1_ASPNN|nr:hypothetical protein FE257_011071 [Aspergillus nanangensis]
MTSIATSTPASQATQSLHLPRITIKYCTQCKWMLRAAYFAQELLSTFSTDLGEVALIPTTGGIFTVTIYSTSTSTSTESSKSTTDPEVLETILWDRKTNGGFPEVKMLKSLVRNVVDPSRDLGHTDRALKAAANVPVQTAQDSQAQIEKGKEECEDCK